MNMDSMFNECLNLKSLDLSTFQTNNVKNMNSMFFGCSSLKTLDISNFNSKNVTNLNSMFDDLNKNCKIECKDAKLKSQIHSDEIMQSITLDEFIY